MLKLPGSGGVAWTGEKSHGVIIRIISLMLPWHFSSPFGSRPDVGTRNQFSMSNCLQILRMFCAESLHLHGSFLIVYEF